MVAVVVDAVVGTSAAPVHRRIVVVAVLAAAVDADPPVGVGVAQRVAVGVAAVDEPVAVVVEPVVAGLGGERGVRAGAGAVGVSQSTAPSLSSSRPLVQSSPQTSPCAMQS
ncbi:MAG: hypothetical protein R3F59_14875 [Myxococcota bacterium]